MKWLIEQVDRLWITALYGLGFRAASLIASLDHYDRSYEPRVKALKVAGRVEESEALRAEWQQALRTTQDRLHLENTKRLLRLAMRLQVPVPKRPQVIGAELNEDWRLSDLGLVLTGTGSKAVRAEIRAELAARQQAILTWVPLVAALSGLVGTVIGLVSVLQR